MKMNVFEKATKKKIRFDHKGSISTEDLWDLDVTELNEIYKKLNFTKKGLSEDSLLEVKTAKETILDTQIEIIKSIVESKLVAQNASILRKEKAEKKEKIMEILASKADDALEKKSPAQLKKMLDDL